MKPPIWIEQLVAENPCIIVGEVKTLSPYGFKSDLKPRKMLDYVSTFADIVSIHTNPLWGGSFEWLAQAVSATRKPVLAKGFHDTIADVKMAFDCGAAHVLTVGWRHPDPRTWYECHEIQEITNTPIDHWIVWNARNPRTGERNLLDVEYATIFGHAHRVCQASCIRSRADIHPRVNAVLIGEALYA